MYWYDREPNFGDWLTPTILSNLGFKYSKGDKRHHDALMVGSIARFAQPGALVLGSGFIRHSDQVPLGVHWEWVRGPLTRGKVRDSRQSCKAIYGDPAWLLPTIWEPPIKKRKLLLVPHYVDFQMARRIYKKLPCLNMLTNDVYKTAMEIASSEYVISSSLHGLIVAHAYGIPAAWVKLSDKLAGDDFKFYDHYASMGMEPICSTVKNPAYQLGSVKTEPMMEVLHRCFR